MSGLPREILKWMQSLDLSYSVKQVRRDFANGFLVAEILSRYYKQEISLHSFENGLGLVKRIENWALLEKFFRKVGFPIEHALIEQVIHCRTDAAIPLMEQLYTLLTHKTVQSSRAVRDREVVPPFARPTASQLIKDRMNEADLAQQELLDEKVAPGKAKIVLATHMQRMKLERELDPARFQPKATSSAASSASATLKPRKSASETFKEVQVRQLDDKGGVLALRANQVYGRTATGQQQGGSPTSPQPQHQHSLSQPSASAFTPSSPSHAHSSSTGPSALSIFSGALLAILGAETPAGAHLLAVAQQANKEPAVVFADTEATSLPDAHAAFVLSQLAAQVSVPLAETSLANPKEFWQLSGVLFTLLSRLPADSAAFMTAVSLVSSIGVRLVSRDAATSTALFMDFSFPKYLALLSAQPRKVFQAAKIAYTFVADVPEEHGKLIREMHQNLMGGAANGSDGSGTFFAILAALAPFEGALLAANGFALLNSYMKLITDGLAASRSFRTRATALSILAPLAANPAFDEKVMRVILRKVRELIPNGPGSEDAAEDGEEEKEEAGVASKLASRIARPLTDDAWLLDAELLHVLSCALSQPWLLTQPALVSQVHGWVEILLHRADDGSANIGAPFPTVRAGLAHLTHVLAAQPPLRKIWLGALLENESLRSRILQLQNAESTAAAAAASSSSSSAPALLADDPAPDLVDSFCPPLRSVWHPLTVCQSLSDQVRVQGLDNLSLGHIELLAAATEDAFGGLSRTANGAEISRPAFPDSEAAEWSALFLALRDHLVVELCEASLSEMVIAILRRFLMDARTSSAAQSLFLPNNAGAAAPPLYCIMRFMFPDASDDAQMNLAGFLEELAALPALVGLVHKNLEVFGENEPAKMAASPLGPLMQKLDEQAKQAGR